MLCVSVRCEQITNSQIYIGKRSPARIVRIILNEGPAQLATETSANNAKNKTSVEYLLHCQLRINWMTNTNQM